MNWYISPGKVERSLLMTDGGRYVDQHVTSARPEQGS